MNNTVKIVIVLALYLIFSPQTYSQESKPIPKDSLVHMVEDYYTLNVKAFQANSTKKDIDTIFDLFTNDFTYIHPKHGGTYSRQKLYEGYIRNQEKGSYDGSVVDIKVVNMIKGLNAVVVERKYINKIENGTQDGEYQMTLFEFDNGKISKIIEYW